MVLWMCAKPNPRGNGIYIHKSKYTIPTGSGAVGKIENCNVCQAMLATRGEARHPAVIERKIGCNL